VWRLLACTPVGDGNQTGEVAPICCDCGERTDLGYDEVSPGGFSGREVAESGAIQGDLSWIDGGEATLEVSLSADEESSTVFWLEPDEPACEPFLSVPVWLQVTTDDGDLAESLRTELTATAADRYSVWTDTYGDSLQGDLDLERFVEGIDPSVARVFFHVERGAVASGSIELDPQDEADDSWEGAQPIATW
jgi:hypothetical protein